MKANVTDPRTVGTYPISEAAHYLGIPARTLRSWVAGQQKQLPQTSLSIHHRLIDLPNPHLNYLSFTNLVEAHVLRVIRKQHGITLAKVRNALDFMQRELKVAHPLARVEFQTDGVDLFVSSVGRLINASELGQLAMREMLKHLLERVEIDEDGIAARLYPYTHASEEDSPK